MMLERFLKLWDSSPIMLLIHVELQVFDLIAAKTMPEFFPVHLNRFYPVLN